VEIIQGNKLKKLQNLFSWSQFYSNSSLTVNRWPNELLMSKANSSDWKLHRYLPFNTVINENRRKADEIQKEIIKLSGNK
jgi:hypothetical protein